MIGFAIPSAAYIALCEHLKLFVNVEFFLDFFVSSTCSYLPT